MTIDDDPELLKKLVDKFLEHSKTVEEGKAQWPAPLSSQNNLFLVTDNVKKDEFKGRCPITFMTPPDNSLIDILEKLTQNLEQLPIQLTAREKYDVSMDLVLSLIMSHVELKDAEEISNIVYQYVKDIWSGENDIRALHIGGSAHAETIKQVLEEELASEKIKIDIFYDPRFENNMVFGSIFDFFNKKIAIRDRISAISIKGFNAYANLD